MIWYIWLFTTLYLTNNGYDLLALAITFGIATVLILWDLFIYELYDMIGVE